VVWVCIAPEAQNAAPTPWVSRTVQGREAALATLDAAGGASREAAIGCWQPRAPCGGGFARPMRPSSGARPVPGSPECY